jgi:uracil-DNA glycosylase family 4
MSLLDIVGAHVKTLCPTGGCATCPRKLVDFVPANLQQGAVLFVGEAPGDTDVVNQEMLTGKGGQLLRTIAAEEGVPGPWSFTSAIHCRPPGNANPQPKEVSACLSEYVLDEIRGYSVVVLVGLVPIHALFPGAKVDHFYGNVAWHPDFPGQRFYSIFHPTQVLKKGPQKQAEFRKQLNRLARIVKGEGPPPWELISDGRALAALREIVKAPLLSFDLETNQLESWGHGGVIRSFTATADGKKIVGATADHPQFKEMLALLGEYLEDPTHAICGANIAFDVEWLERECDVLMKCEVVLDTGITWYEADQYQMPSLKELVSRELDGYRYLIHEPHKMRDKQLLLFYNAEDVVHPLELVRAGFRRIGRVTRELVSRVLGPVSIILRRIEATGFLVREEYRQQKIAEYNAKRRGILLRWRETDPEFIPTKHESGNGLLEYLFEIRRLPILVRTEGSEQPSTDQSVIKQLVRDGYEICQYLLDLRSIDKKLSTYVIGYEKFLWADSRLRSSYTLTYTDSGRTSSRKPNLQNVARDREIRDLFGAPSGWVLLESDLSQIEFRIMVCLAGDETGIAGYSAGLDAHTITARAITGSDSPTSEQRSRAKPINFCFLYGAQASTAQQTVADDYDVIWSDREARLFRDTFMGTYKRIPEFHDKCRNDLVANAGMFESIVGHRFHYADWNSKDGSRRDHAARAYINAQAQGPAVAICYYIMVQAMRLLEQRGLMRDVRAVNHVHDSVVMEVRDGYQQAVVEVMNDAAQLAYEWVKHWFVVPLLMEHKAGESWGSLKTIA